MISLKLLLTVSAFFLLGCGSHSAKDKTTNLTLTTLKTPSDILNLNNQEPKVAVQVNDKWQLIWSDEFNGSTIDLTKWSFEVNCSGSGNGEHQCYTNRKENAFIEQGVLKIVALNESFTGPALHDDDPSYHSSTNRTLPFTSARLRSKNKGDWTFGRFEIRAKLPQGQGTWPAIWMLPTAWAYGGWAGSGEIDIMEAVNLKTQSDQDGAILEQEEARVHGTLHYGRAWPENVYSGKDFLLPNGVNPADNFHVYTIEWQEGEIRWYVDNIHFATQRDTGWYTQYMNNNASLINGIDSAPFDQKFHLILNFAVGGNWPEATNDKGINNNIFPQSFDIDYVRVYQCSTSPLTGLGCETIGDKATLVEGPLAPAL